MSEDRKDVGNKGKFVSMYGGKLGYTQDERDAALAALKGAVVREPHKFWAFRDTVNVDAMDEDMQHIFAQLEIAAARADA
ncbi:hypothetical protein [Acidiferrobacter sp.]|jgi:hypothetical protein|uniref:hypothetical protein n=1 Tax=Acidiferrobacter sp. TaxID=1872107 RepID=UPI0026355EFA|nr:hypothetical protein [Acidiferrobacter sp.]